MASVATATKTLREVLGSVAVATVPADVSVSGVCLDTRLAIPGSLYLALRGASSHGLDHLDAAVAAGVVAVAAEPADLDAFVSLRERASAAGVTIVAVPDLKTQAPGIAARFFDDPSRALTVIAVTGTDGKTSVCRFVQSALEALGVACGYVGTLGWGMPRTLAPTALTTPDCTVLQNMLASMRASGATHVVLEASSHGIAEGRLDAVAIDMAVLTNLGRDHLDYHGDEMAYRQAKARLFDWPGLGCIVVNGSDALGADLLRQRRQRPLIRHIAFTSHASDAAANDCAGLDDTVIRISASEVRSTDTGLQFTLLEDDSRVAVDSPLIGGFNVDNLLACNAVLRGLGHAANEAGATLSAIAAVPGRMERFVASGADTARPTVVVDFAHTPQALGSAIAAARGHCRGSLWVVFGCGGDRDRGKRAPMGRAAEAADHVIVTDDNPRTEAAASIRQQIVAGMRDPARASVVADRSAAITHAVTTAAADDLVLVAGKGHEDYQIIGTTRHDFSDRRLVAALMRRTG